MIIKKLKGIDNSTMKLDVVWPIDHFSTKERVTKEDKIH